MAGHYFDTILDEVTGKPVKGATLTVYQDGATISGDRTSVTSGTLATIYSDDGVTSVVGAAVTTDAFGFFEFYTDESIVVFEIAYGGSAKRAIDNVDILGGTVSSDVTTLTNRADHIDTLIGISANHTDLGSFTGSTIGDNESVKEALQDLETAVETAAAADALLSANNLSDVASASASRTNLGAAAHDPSIQAVTSSATVTPTFSDDQINITAQGAGLTLANPSGTAVPAWGIVIRIKDDGTARSISYGTLYRAIGVTLPTTTVIGKTLYLGMIYNSTDTKWDVVVVAQEA